MESLRCGLKGCPCGYLYHPKKVCTCTQREIEKYRKRISGPILDRIDLYVEVPVVDIKAFSCDEEGKSSLESSKKIIQRVIAARHLQTRRFSREAIYTNAEMRNKHIKKYCRLSKEVSQILIKAGINFSLSARSYFKMIRIARTIADLEGAPEILLSHMAEALQYRPELKVSEQIIWRPVINPSRIYFGSAQHPSKYPERSQRAQD